MRHALIVAAVLCGLGFSATEASARPVHHRAVVTKVVRKHLHKKHAGKHHKGRTHRHHKISK